MTGYAEWDVALAQGIIDRLKGLEGASLPILHALQHEFGFIHSDAVPLIADALNVSRADIHGTITFYHEFRQTPPARRVIRLCRAEACQAVGAEQLVAHLKSHHGISMDTMSADGGLRVETVYCLGNCALGPSALVDGEIIGRLDEGVLSDLCASAPAVKGRG